MLSFRALSLTAPLALAAMGSAQTVLLRFKPPVGKTVSYVTTMSMSQNIPGSPKPMAFSQTMPMTYRVISRTGNATTLETKMGKVKVDVPAGSPMAGMKANMEKQTSGMVYTTTADEFGNLKGVDAKGLGAGPAMARQMGAGMMSGAQGVSYPKQALKVGDTWSASLDFGKLMGGGMAGSGMKASGKIPIVYKLVGIEKRGGMTLAKLSLTMKGTTTMTMPAGSPAGAQGMAMKMNSVGSLVVDTATGLLQSMTNVSNTDMAIMGQNMRQHMVMTMKAK